MIVGSANLFADVLSMAAGDYLNIPIVRVGSSGGVPALRNHQNNVIATSVQIGRRDGLRVVIDVDSHLTLSGSLLHVSYAAAEPTSRTQTWMS